MGVSSAPCYVIGCLGSHLLSVGRIIHQETKEPRLSTPVIQLSRRTASNPDDNVLRTSTEDIASLTLGQDAVSQIVLFPNVPTDPASTETVFADTGLPFLATSSPEFRLQRWGLQ